MASTYLPPPPTSNHLDLNQKSRLIKSTRKLGQVLGTTPYLLEIPTELPISFPLIESRTSSPTPSTSSAESIKSVKRSRRQGSIFINSPIVHSASSSTSSLSLPGDMPPSSVDLPSTHLAPVSRRSKDTHRPPPLVLHLNPVIVSPDDHRIGKAQLSPPPTLPAFDDFPMSPMTPTSNAFYHQKKAADAKRKKVDKINRTFGESVPTELIFPTLVKPNVSYVSRQPAVTRKRRSMTINTTQVWCTGSQAWVGEWNRGNIQEVQAQLRQLKAR
jgi:hypothetical protein